MSNSARERPAILAGPSHPWEDSAGLGWRVWRQHERPAGLGAQIARHIAHFPNRMAQGRITLGEEVHRRWNPDKSYVFNRADFPLVNFFSLAPDRTADVGSEAVTHSTASAPRPVYGSSERLAVSRSKGGVRTSNLVLGREILNKSEECQGSRSGTAGTLSFGKSALGDSGGGEQRSLVRRRHMDLGVRRASIAGKSRGYSASLLLQRPLVQRSNSTVHDGTPQILTPLTSDTATGFSEPISVNNIKAGNISESGVSQDAPTATSESNAVPQTELDHVVARHALPQKSKESSNSIQLSSWQPERSPLLIARQRGEITSGLHNLYRKPLKPLVLPQSVQRGSKYNVLTQLSHMIPVSGGFQRTLERQHDIASGSEPDRTKEQTIQQSTGASIGTHGSGSKEVARMDAGAGNQIVRRSTAGLSLLGDRQEDQTTSMVIPNSIGFPGLGQHAARRREIALFRKGLVTGFSQTGSETRHTTRGYCNLGSKESMTTDAGLGDPISQRGIGARFLLGSWQGQTFPMVRRQGIRLFSAMVQRSAVGQDPNDFRRGSDAGFSQVKAETGNTTLRPHSPGNKKVATAPDAYGPSIPGWLGTSSADIGVQKGEMPTASVRLVSAPTADHGKAEKLSMPSGTTYHSGVSDTRLYLKPVSADVGSESAMLPLIGGPSSIGHAPLDTVNRYSGYSGISPIVIQRKHQVLSGAQGQSILLRSLAPGKVLGGSRAFSQHAIEHGVSRFLAGTDSATVLRLRDKGASDPEPAGSHAPWPVSLSRLSKSFSNSSARPVAMNIQQASAGSNAASQDRSGNLATQLPLVPQFNIRRETGTSQELSSPASAELQRQTAASGGPLVLGSTVPAPTADATGSAASETGGSGQAQQSTDDIVDKVWRKIMRKFALEQERGGWNRWP